jgi:DNA topoisomerase-1
MAQQNLVIVESPAKARTISRILGKDYCVMASMGHVRDLPEKTLGVDVRNGFQPLYQETKGRGNVVKELRTAAAKAAHIYLAPDPDREGEAIAWHLHELLAPATKATFQRVVFHEITRSAVSKAFEHPGELEMNRVNSQQARRVLDRLVGYQVSPLLWSRVEGGSSAGRVQTVALRIVCEREREIRAFVPVEYWTINALLSPVDGEGQFRARLARIDGEKSEVRNQETADRVAAALRGEGPLQVTAVETKPKKRYAPPPFITSTLQQAAGATLRLGASRTMQLAQQLYEGLELGDSGPTGLITYMRTDSVAVADEAQRACRELIAARFGADYVPEKPNTYRNRAGAQGAHEAIRPTDVTRVPEAVAAFLDPAQLKLYTLIWKRFVASQMRPAELAVTGVDVSKRAADGRDYQLKAEATAVVFPGFTSVYQARESDDEEEEEEEEMAPAALLVALRPGLPCRLDELKPEQKFTEPPPRFSEATLIRELESNGIGRPSTYASIVNTIQQRNYVAKDKSKLIPTEVGFQVTDFLVANLNDLFQVGFTAGMEEKLDQIEEGKVEWSAMLQEFYDELCRHLGVAKMAGAPESDVAGELLALFAPVKEWAPPTKRGKRTYSDAAFVASLGDQFRKQAKLTERQWSALLKMAAKYRDQIPGLDEFVGRRGLNLADPAAPGGDTGVDKVAVADLFAAMEKVSWSPPTERKGRTYDDGAFIRSLREQAEGGKALSGKQLAALTRIAARYQEQIPGFTALAGRLGVAAEDAGEPVDPAKAAESAAEIDVLLRQLADVKEWGAPVKKGKRVFDDQVFFQSLDRQFKDRKSLSPKQISALKRMASRYSEGAGKTA